METTITPRAVLIFLALYLLAVPRSDAGRLSLMGRAAGCAQAPANNGGASDTLKDSVLGKMSAMGRIAHLVTTAQLRGVKTATAIAAPGDDLLVPGGQAQPSIAVDSTGQHIVIGSNDAGGFGLDPISVSGFRYSDDGGRTFTDGGQLPITTPTSSIGPTTYPEVFG